LIGFLAIYLFQFIFTIIIDRLNYKHLERRGEKVAAVFEGFIDSEKLHKINEYTQDNNRFSLIHRVISESILLALILSGFLVFVDHYSTGLQLHFVWAGLFFFAVLGFILFVLDLPFDYFQTFVIEEKYGFNRSSLRTWVTDHLKAGLLSVFLLALILSPILWAIRAFPESWWFWGFLFVSGFQILLTVLYPILIAPIFNRFEPLDDPVLIERLKGLMKEVGLRIKGIFQMDAGKRSRHTNAYFTGLGKTKRVVLFDTLVNTHPKDEIIAILAHELGHFKAKHILKQLIVFEASMLAVFFLVYQLMEWPLLYSTFGFDAPRSHFGLFITGIFWQKVGFFLRPLYMALSRRFEREADAFSIDLMKEADPMVTALKRMAADNLANLAPHPIYVWFNASHPPLAERIATLEKAGSKILNKNVAPLN
jgi:STE24 endopeptidase